MSKWLMQEHFRHLHFDSFPIIWTTPQGKLFWPLQLNSEVSGVSEDSQVPILGVWMSSSHSSKSGLRHSSCSTFTFVDLNILSLRLKDCSTTFQFTCSYWRVHYSTTRFESMEPKFLLISVVQFQYYSGSWNFQFSILKFSYLCFLNSATLTTYVGWLGHPISWVFATTTIGLSHRLPLIGSFASPHLLFFFVVANRKPLKCCPWFKKNS